MRILILSVCLASPAVAAPMVPRVPGLPIIEPASPAPEHCGTRDCDGET